MEAIRELKWERVTVHIVHDMDGALKLLQAERDENTCRKDFTRSEAVAIGKAIEELEKPKAKERQKATQVKGKDKDGKPLDRERSCCATIVIMTTVAQDGQEREVVMIDLDTLPMWLATFDGSRVGEAVRLAACPSPLIQRNRNIIG